MGTRLRVKVIVFFIYGVILIGGTEILLRLFWPTEKIWFECSPPAYYKSSPDPRIGYELRPLVEDINSDGLRDVEHTISKKEGVTRIAVLGDSIAYGFGVERDKTYAKTLERFLNQGGQARYETINFGISGYGLAQILQRFKTKALKYNPDVVIYGQWFNDFHKLGCGGDEYPFFRNMGARLWEGYTSAVLRWQWLRYFRTIVLNSEIFRRTAFVDYILHKKYVSSESIPQGRPSLDLKDREIHVWYDRFSQCVSEIAKDHDVTFLDSEVNWKDFREYWTAFQELAQVCHGKSIRLIMLITPVIGNFSDYPYRPLHRFVSDLARAFGAEVVDTLDDFSEKYKVSSDDNIHFDALGHELVGRRLAEQVLGGKDLY